MRNFITILVPLVFLCSCSDDEPQDASEVRKEMLEVQDQIIAVKKQKYYIYETTKVKKFC